MLMLLTACLHRAPASAGSMQGVHAYKIEAFGQTLAGLGVFASDGDELVFQSLTPAGTVLFQVRDTADGDPVVTAPDETMAAMLGRIPWYRDLSLLFRWECDDTVCSTETGRVRPIEDGLTYRGGGGRASVTDVDDVMELVDPKRRYTLTVVK
jgi:hypothetical protein